MAIWQIQYIDCQIKNSLILPNAHMPAMAVYIQITKFINFANTNRKPFRLNLTIAKVTCYTVLIIISSPRWSSKATQFRVKWKQPLWYVFIGYYHTGRHLGRKQKAGVIPHLSNTCIVYKTTVTKINNTTVHDKTMHHNYCCAGVQSEILLLIVMSPKTVPIAITINNFHFLVSICIGI